jgi:hypothetical protein
MDSTTWYLGTGRFKGQCTYWPPLLFRSCPSPFPFSLSISKPLNQFNTIKWMDIITTHKMAAIHMLPDKDLNARINAKKAKRKRRPRLSVLYRRQRAERGKATIAGTENHTLRPLSCSGNLGKKGWGGPPIYWMWW